MKTYTFGGIKPAEIFRVYHSNDYKQIEIVTVIGHHLYIDTPTKAEYNECVKQLIKYCDKEKIGVEVCGYEEN